MPAVGGFLVPKQDRPHYVTTGDRRKAARVMAPTIGIATRRLRKRFPDRNFDAFFEVVPMGV